MTTDDFNGRPLLNPVLELQKSPTPERAQGGGVSAKDIVRSRLAKQRTYLSSILDGIAENKQRLTIHGEKLHLVVKMFDDSFATSKAPKSLFDKRFHSQLVAPLPAGYLAEVSVSKLPQLARFIQTSSATDAMVSISRVKDISVFNSDDIWNGQSIRNVWESAAEVPGGRAFVLWLAPFHDSVARTSVINTLGKLEHDQVMLPTYPGISLPSAEAQPLIRSDQTALARAIRRYRNDNTARSFVTIPSQAALKQLAASGSSFRIDPVKRLEVTAPGIGSEPVPPLGNAATQPIVAVVDGGLTAQSYKKLEAWRAPPLVPDGAADFAHGNRVSSLVVHAHAWNNKLNLPDITCRLATAQAIPRSNTNFTCNQEQLIEYLKLVARNCPEARVWNMSFNEISPADDPNLVSYLGHEISRIAREAGILPVISVGNRRKGNSDHLCAPADCEAALTVGGRSFDENGLPSDACSLSLHGPGPDGMLKPDLSWFSELRMLGGGVQTGSSYATPLVSALAAHTFENLKDPSPDLVRALLINNCELEAHDRALGWGTPWQGHLPWVCAPGSVTLIWRAKLRPGFAYYWNDIPIPPELIKDGKMFGTGRLTAILDPLVSELGSANYFATRLQVALQYRSKTGKISNLLGSMKEDTKEELAARADLSKWQPIRRHVRDFRKRGGITFSGNTMRLHARIFSRDLFEFDMDTHHEMGEQDVAFVLTLNDGSDSMGIYNSTVQRLGNFVESAILEQHVENEQTGQS